MQNISENSKKITFFIGALTGGGAEGVCVNLANGLAYRGWDVTLLTLHSHGSVYHERVSKEVNFVTLGCRRASLAYVPLRRWLTKHRSEQVVVFNHGLAALLVLIRATSFCRFRLIARNINTLSYKLKSSKGFARRKVINPLMFSLFRRVDHVVNQCEDMRADLINLFPDLEYKSSVIYNPVNKDIEDTAKNLDFTTTKKSVSEDYILCIGRLNEQKAFHFAIQAFADLSDKYPGLRLKVLGEGPMETTLRTQVKQLRIDHLVDFEGFQPDVVKFYRNARLTLLTSLYEGFPNVLIESITLGTPVVAFDCPSGPREIIKEERNGQLASYQDLNALKKGIEKVIDSDVYTADEVYRSSLTFSFDNILTIWESLLLSSNMNRRQDVL